ncbi:MAG: RluA family pseudouridine synthase [Prevotella sp.]|nr:RluA family pseudouridine synthase [Staphylococcus sp.]MCM1349761.1 RluA family pseudouridine synthase [Prevotella sp.]
MIQEQYIVDLSLVEIEGTELRIDKYLAEVCEDLSRSEIRDYFDMGLVSVGTKVVKPSFKIKDGDCIHIQMKPTEEIDMVKENIPLDIVYEDDEVIVVNKPSGMVVHPAPGHPHQTLVNALLYHCNGLSDIGGDIRAGIVHRIDKDTSGLLVACKTNHAHKILSDQLKNKTTTRKYIAIVTGSIGHNLGKINAPIGRDPNNRQKMAVVEDGKSAVTHFKVLDRYPGFTLVELQLETGRTHQIRVHMAYIGHPVMNDPLYGVKKQTTPFGQYLHAKTLGFYHPTTGEYLEFTSELPFEFKDMIERLEKSC